MGNRFGNQFLRYCDVKFLLPKMKSLRTLFLLAVLSPALSCSQDRIPLQEIERLPKAMKEVSGMEYDRKHNLLWMVNDSGNTNELFGYDPKSLKMAHQITIDGAVNIDWEDLAQGPNGWFFIGDFGNNKSKRQDLKIYGIQLSDPNLQKSLTPWTLEFSLEDQKEFPPKSKKKSFDVESFFYLDGHFYLFSRNRARKFNGKSRVYRLEAKSGKQIAKRIGTFEACPDRKDCQITSAAISPDGTTIALLSYNKIWLLREFNGTDFLNGKVSKFKLHHRSQKESITFKDDQTLYLADERRNGSGRNLYRISISDLESHAKSK